MSCPGKGTKYKYSSDQFSFLMHYQLVGTNIVQ